MNFEREKKILTEAFSKSLTNLLTKYDLKDIPEGVINDVLCNAIGKTVCNSPAREVDSRCKDNGSDSDMDTDNASESDSSQTSTVSGPSDEEEFTTVENKRRKTQRKRSEEKKAKNQGSIAKLQQQQSVKEQGNYYQLLQPKVKEPVQAPVGEKKVSRPPPIICYNLNVAHFNDKLDKLPSRPKFFLKNTNKTRCTIKPATEEDRKVLFGIIQGIKVDCYTFTPKDERKVSLVLKGVQCSFTPEQVLEALRDELPEAKIASVSRLETPRTKKNGPINAFVVNLEKGSDIQAVMKINRLLYQVVYWERFQSQGISQCKNCQAFGHVASNCGRKYKCVKCSEKHGPGECRRNPTEGEPFCTNCGKLGHPANYRGCPKYKEVLQNKKTAQEEKRQREQFARESARNFVQPGKSFAQIISNSTNKVPMAKLPTKPNPTPNIANTRQVASSSEIDDFCTKEAKTLFGCDLFSLMGKINAFLPQYRKLTSLADRQSAYLQFAFSLCTSRP